MKKSKEKKVVYLMIKLYCKKKHGFLNNKLCADCQSLLNYVENRLSKCPYGDKKPFCSNCKIHCYNKPMQAKIKKVMRFSRPRIIFYHPGIAINHMLLKHKRKRNYEKRT